MNVTKRKPFTSGEILKEEFMLPYQLMQTKLAKLISVLHRRINEIINGKRGITLDTAIRLGRLFKMSLEFWLNLQQKTKLWVALHKESKAW